MNNTYENNLHGWITDEKAAIELISMVGQLWFDKSVELILYRNQLIDRSNSEVLNLHHYARTVVKQNLTIQDTLAITRTY
jgi:glyceraldehyde 3-phosphate dehydrogenase